MPCRSLSANEDLRMRHVADPGEIGDPQSAFDSNVPAAFTYFGQPIANVVVRLGFAGVSQLCS